MGINLFPAEVLTGQHRYLKARAQVDGDSLVITSMAGKRLEEIPLQGVEPAQEGGWWVWPDVKVRFMAGCATCGGTQIL